MLLKIDGFDHYVTADITKKWQAGGAGTIGPTSGRAGGGAYLGGNGQSGWIADTFAAGASWVIGARVRLPTLPTVSPAQLFTLYDVATPQCSLIVNLDGTLEVRQGTATAVTGGKSILSIQNGIDYYIELKVTIANSIAANSCKVRVNGVDWITVTTGQDLQATANAFANQIRIGNVGNNGTQSIFDDLYIADQSGSTNNDFLGDIRVDTLYPISDGTYAQFTPSTGSTHYVLVDETAPNLTDYNAGTTVGDRDSYVMSNLVPLVSQTVYGVQSNLAVLKDDAGAKSIAPFVRSGTTNGDGASVGIGTSQFIARQIFEQDPAAVAAWTETTVNGAELGALVTV